MVDVIQIHASRGFSPRHLLWMIPLGLLVVVMIGVGVITLYFKHSARRIRESEPYQNATARALADTGVVKVLGAPVVVGKVAVGSVDVRDDGSGEADFHFNLVGRWRSALVQVKATRSGETWKYSEMYFLPWGGGDGIELTNNGAVPATQN